MKLIGRIDGKMTRKWIWVGVAGLLGLVALRIYFLQELLAALLLFALAFAAIALVVLGIYLLGSAGDWSFGWIGRHWRCARQLLHRGWILAGKFSKKRFHRPRSAPAR